MYENYLLKAEVIKEWVVQKMKKYNLEVVEDEILTVIESHKWDSSLFEPKTKLDPNDIVFWVKNVHGANYLNLDIQNCTEKKIFQNEPNS